MLLLLLLLMCGNASAFLAVSSTKIQRTVFDFVSRALFGNRFDSEDGLQTSHT